MRTEKNSRDLRATEAAFTSILSATPSVRGRWGGWVRDARPRPPPPCAPGAGALRITAAASVSRRGCDEPGRLLGPDAAFRRLSPFGDPHQPARFHAGRPCE